MTKRRELNVPGARGTPLHIKPMTELLLIPRYFKPKKGKQMDWEIMVDELSEPQTSPFYEIIEDGPPHSNGDRAEVQ